MSDAETEDRADSAKPSDQVDGPGCMPAVLASVVLLGIASFVCCGVSTWFLYEQRAVFAQRTLTETAIPTVEQSRMAPDDKEAVLAEFKKFAESLERNEVENWQAAAVMQRIVRLPILEWGDLQAVEEILRSDAGDHTDALMQFSRLRRGIEMNQVTTVEMEEVLKPVIAADGSMDSRRTLAEPITVQAALEVAERAKLVADISKVPNQEFDDINIGKSSSSVLAQEALPLRCNWPMQDAL
jgi:hypothetical protein